MSLGRGAFGKIKEKKMEKKINNDLAIVASQIPGGAIHDTDGLSRRSNWKKGEEGDNEERTLLKPERV